MPSTDMQFIGALRGKSTVASNSRYLNLYPMVSSDGRSIIFSTPGLSEFVDIGSGLCRGLKVFGDVLIAVFDDQVYSITSAGVATNIFDIGTTTGDVSMEDNGTDLMLVDGSAGYLWDGATMTTGIANFPSNPDTVAFIDGYFIVNEGGTGRFHYNTDPYVPETWAALNFNTAEASPDILMAVASTFGYIYAFGDKTTEVWYDAAATSGPFLRIDGMVMQCGLMAPFSPQKIGDSGNVLLWLADTPNGGGFVVKNSGGQSLERASTPELEQTWSSYSTMSDARSFGYKQDGSTFYVLQFPTAGHTWVYDTFTSRWHERSSAGGRWYADYYARFNGQHVVASAQTSKLYYMSNSYTSDDGVEIERELVGPTLGGQDEMITWHSIQIEMDNGVGTYDGQGEDPVILLSWSDDAGRTWSQNRELKIGKAGEYLKRVITWQLGRSYKMTPRIRVTDPVPISILSATINAS